MLKDCQKIICFQEDMYHFFHDYKQPLSVISLLGSDIVESYSNQEIDMEYIVQYASMLSRQIKKIDDMVESCRNKLTMSFQDSIVFFCWSDIFEILKDIFTGIAIEVIVKKEEKMKGSKDIAINIIFALLDFMRQFDINDSKYQHNEHNYVFFIEDNSLTFTLPNSLIESFRTQIIPIINMLIKAYNRKILKEKINQKMILAETEHEFKLVINLQ